MDDNEAKDMINRTLADLNLKGKRGSIWEFACCRAWNASGEENIQSYDQIRNLPESKIKMFKDAADEALRLLEKRCGETPTDIKYVGRSATGEPAPVDFGGELKFRPIGIEDKLIMEGGIPNSIRPAGGQPTPEGFVREYLHITPWVAIPDRADLDYHPRIRRSCKEVVMESHKKGTFHVIAQRMYSLLTCADYMVMLRRPTGANKGFGDVIVAENNIVSRGFRWDRCEFVSRCKDADEWGGIANTFSVVAPGSSKPVPVFLVEVQPKSSRVQFRFVVNGLLDVTGMPYETNNMWS